MPFSLIVSFLLAFTVLSGCTEVIQQTTDVERGPDVEHGRYLVEIMGCNDCHTPDYMGSAAYLPEDDWLVGGDLGFYGSWGTSYPSNLRLMLNSLSEEDWLALARKMRQRSPMAWSRLPNATNQDLIAIYRFVRYLGPKGTPAPARLPPGVMPTTDKINFPDPH